METPETGRKGGTLGQTGNGVFERARAEVDRVELEFLEVVERLHNARRNVVHGDDPSRVVQKRLRATVWELDQALTRERLARRETRGLTAGT